MPHFQWVQAGLKLQLQKRSSPGSQSRPEGPASLFTPLVSACRTASDEPESLKVHCAALYGMSSLSQVSTKHGAADLPKSRFFVRSSSCSSDLFARERTFTQCIKRRFLYVVKKHSFAITGCLIELSNMVEVVCRVHLPCETLPRLPFIERGSFFLIWAAGLHNDSGRPSQRGRESGKFLHWSFLIPWRWISDVCGFGYVRSVQDIRKLTLSWRCIRMFHTHTHTRTCICIYLNNFTPTHPFSMYFFSYAGAATEHVHPR